MSTNAPSGRLGDRQDRRSRDGVARSGAALAVLAVVAVAVVAGVVLRGLLARTPLWLDEAQTVAIARLPLGDIPAALRQDGHPPLYYVLLHAWMAVLGQGDAAVRSLSAVFGVVALAPLAALGRRLGGTPTALAALALAASSPFLVRYATEARMYALVVLLALTWWLAVLRALEAPTLGRLAVVAALVAALLLTHYWSAFLLAAGGVLLLRRAAASTAPLRGAPGLALAAHVAGGLAFLPWLPSLVVQLRRTGTPWASAPDPVSALAYTLADYAGAWARGPGLALYAVLLALLALGTLARPLDAGRIELDLRVAPAARTLAALLAITAGAGLGLVWVTGTAFAPRYLAVAVGFTLLLAARGVTQLPQWSQRAVLLAVAVALGLVGSWRAVGDDRSQGAQVAAAVAARAGDDAVVVACPDQLGPAVARYLPDGVLALGYPLLTPAHRVDWTDYAERNAAADPARLADRIVARAGGAEVFLVWNGGYRTMEGECERLRRALGLRLGEPVEVVSPRPGVFEPMRLTRFRSPTG